VIRIAGEVDPAEQLALGLGDVRVAGADDHRDRLQALDPERQPRQCLDAAETDDLIGAAGRHRVQHPRMDALTSARGCAPVSCRPRRSGSSR
jgi:hypothetical protein